MSGMVNGKEPPFTFLIAYTPFNSFVGPIPTNAMIHHIIDFQEGGHPGLILLIYLQGCGGGGLRDDS